MTPDWGLREQTFIKFLNNYSGLHAIWSNSFQPYFLEQAAAWKHIVYKNVVGQPLFLPSSSMHCSQSHKERGELITLTTYPHSQVVRI